MGNPKIWSMELEIFTGKGPEGLGDGSYHEAFFAQPNGLALDDQTLYVANSETSAIRVLHLDTETVETMQYLPMML
jgi:sugar lactone lactonase YvrE